jgi:hypothetical protein
VVGASPVLECNYPLRSPRPCVRTRPTLTRCCERNAGEHGPRAPGSRCLFGQRRPR